MIQKGKAVETGKITSNEGVAQDQQKALACELGVSTIGIMNLSTLNDFSLLVYKLLLKAYPQWTELIVIPEEYPTVVLLVVPSPQSTELELEISTFDEEITVSYGHFHSHFGWSDVPDEEAFSKAKEMVDEILTDKLLIAEYWKGGKFYQSETAQFSELQKYRNKGPGIRVIGWTKTYIQS